MRAKNTLFVLSIFFSVGVFSQTRLITCSTERNSDNSVSIIADSQAQGEYTVKLNFTSLTGYSTSAGMSSNNIALITTYRGRKEIMRLTPIKSAGMYSMQYSYQYFPGTVLRKKPDTSFTYLLPAAESVPLRVFKVNSITEKLGQKSKDEFSAVGFIYHLGDTISAARAGTVYDCSNEAREGEKSVEMYNRNSRNKIYIQHKDGTLGQYSVLAPIQLLVQPGDNVIPGQPLAVFNKESEKYTVLFSVDYLDEKKALADNSNIDPKLPPPVYYLYVPTFFYVDENNKSIQPEQNKQYNASHPKEIIGAEMSKKDKKKLGLQ